MERLKQKVVEFGGEEFVARSDRTLYWPREEMLIVADVHIGKSEAFRELGITLPDGVMSADLARLSSAIGATQAKRLLVVGDLVHAGEGFTPLVDARMTAWREQEPLSIWLVRGNHDRNHDRWFEAWGITVLEPTVRLRSIAFAHEPRDLEYPSISGHLHPAITMRSGSDHVRLPCFVFGTRRAILPAFSEFTGGAPYLPSRDERVLAIAGHYLVDVSP